ncbi:LysM peptidoglycan-binding domain-containing protein [Clostridium beijerinckii]|uniref:Nucleoid-associated protein YgaU n=1 Tax=Clostridium beijerinckii TaxID=1520 RepID=A0AAE5LT17_CLOBE|nr:LysM peptidoglycan-binding domain-containing protein [Clostridium beijerinckii]NSB17432.1 nucleoid-associated protein YgaU [Clostridium beijerinckii]OOM28456.1 LysM domain/BON superfamily protein [Clostridium beijerinckii]
MKLHYIKNSIENIKLPIVPSEFHIKSGKNSNSVTLLGFGEISDSGTPTLRTWSISSIFPKTKYKTCTGSIKSNPYDYVQLVEKLKRDNIVCQYIITKTNIDMRCTIEEFEYWENDGSGDVYYTMTFKEHKEIKLSTLGNTNMTSSVFYMNSDYTLDTTKENKLVVRQGDNIVKIAKQYLGDSSKYEDILAKNGLSNPDDVKPGMVLLL